MIYYEKEYARVNRFIISQEIEWIKQVGGVAIIRRVLPFAVPFTFLAMPQH